MKKRIVFILVIVILAVSLCSVLAACETEILRGEDFGLVIDKEIKSIDLRTGKEHKGPPQHTYIDAIDADPEIFRWAKKGIEYLTKNLYLEKKSQKLKERSEYVITYADNTKQSLYLDAKGEMEQALVYIKLNGVWYETNKSNSAKTVYFEEAYDTKYKREYEEPDPFFDIRQIGIKQVEIADVATGKKAIIDSANSALASIEAGCDYLMNRSFQLQLSVRDIAAECTVSVTLKNDVIYDFAFATRGGHKEDIYLQYDNQWYFVHDKTMAEFTPLVQPALDQLA